ncbi:MAG TPA: hypothetical protein QF764_00545 [Planctomycetota bacterium]|jgi:hypothetical protein|nr:hypothetical protein [Planctomycetota bacterium]
MKKTTLSVARLLIACGTFCAVSGAASQDSLAEARFKSPVRLTSGEQHLGAKRLYPSPALHDMNGDGRADLVVADLFGRPTVAFARAGKGLTFGQEEALLDRDGEKLDFNNW